MRQNKGEKKSNLLVSGQFGCWWFGPTSGINGYGHDDLTHGEKGRLFWGINGDIGEKTLCFFWFDYIFGDFRFIYTRFF